MKNKSFLLGYSIVFHSILMFFIFGAFTTSGMNVWIPAFVANYGLDRSSLLMMATIGGIIGVIGTIVFGQIVAKRGGRIVITISLIICGLTIIAFGHAATVIAYMLCMVVFNFMSHGFCNVGSNAVIANWFPTKKGFILGITTMGLPAASFLFVPILSKTIGGLGMTKAFLLIGICIVLLGIASWFWIKNTPQEVGLLPDNGKGSSPVNSSSQTTIWTIKKLLCNKTAWLIALAYGILFMVTQGMVSQTVSYLIEGGFQQATAVSTLSLAAAIGVVGSFIWGILDDKIGTKKTSIIYAVWYVITFILLFLNAGVAVAMIGVVMLGASLGGIGNLMPSMMISAFGPTEFASVSRVVTTVCNVVRSFAFFLMAIGLRIFGTYHQTIILLIIFTVIALVMIFFIKENKRS